MAPMMSLGGLPEAVGWPKRRNPPIDRKLPVATPATPTLCLKEKSYTNPEVRYGPCNVSIGLVIVIPGLFSTCV